jgi:hypothetical protein
MPAQKPGRAGTGCGPGIPPGQFSSRWPFGFPFAGRVEHLLRHWPEPGKALRNPSYRDTPAAFGSRSARGRKPSPSSRPAGSP